MWAMGKKYKYFRYLLSRAENGAGCHWTSAYHTDASSIDASIDAIDLQLIHCTHHRKY